MISVRGANVEFEDGTSTVHALSDVHFDAEAGQFVLVEGPSGSGKSTLLNVISGLQRVDSGSIVVAGVELDSARPNALAAVRLHHVGVVFQSHNLIAEFSASENVQVPLRAQGVSGSAARAEAREALSRVGVADLEDRRPRNMSGGQRQRVGIARAIVGGRRVLVADEPTGSLDSVNSEAIFTLLRSLANTGSTVVVASHDPIATSFADRTLFMRDGVLAEVRAS